MRWLAAVLLLGACGEIKGAGDPALWRMEGDELVGTTDGTLTQNSFYTFEGEYADFELDVQFKIKNGNSGIQFRSELLPDYVVKGYQGDVSTDGYLGILYEERGRGFLGLMMIPNVYDHFRPEDWNDYRITAIGPRITLAVNGFTTVDYTESDANARKSGVIAVQVHVGPAMEVRYRNMKIVVR
jgi:hypothetical protein